MDEDYLKKVLLQAASYSNIPGMKQQIEELMANRNTKASDKRIERKKKLKRVFNYDAEYGFLESFRNLKKGISIEEFETLAKKTLIETEQVSDVVFEYFIDELKIKEKIEQKKEELQSKLNETRKLQEEIRELENSLDDDVDDEDNIGSFGGSDPCRPTPLSTRSSC
jgi:hypothetical protein